MLVCLMLAGAVVGAESEDSIKSPDSVDVGPGFGPRWLSINSLGFAYPVYDVLDSYPYNRLVITKVYWDGAPGARNEITNIPIGNSKTENSIHFIYDSRYRQLGYAISNAADRYGSAHGLQVGVVHLSASKPRVYLESANYRSDGYNQLAGVSMALDSSGFVASWKGDLYFMEFGDAGSRMEAEVGGSFRDSYVPNFDDSSIKARSLRTGHGTQYPVYYSNENILVAEQGTVSMYNTRTQKLKTIINIGKKLSGVALSENRKTIAILQDSRLLLFDVEGNELQQVDIEIPNARNITLSPDGQYVAFDNLEHVFVKRLVITNQPASLDNEPPAIFDMPARNPEPVPVVPVEAPKRRRSPFDNEPASALRQPAKQPPAQVAETPVRKPARSSNRLPKRPKRRSGSGLDNLPEIIKTDPTEKCTSTAKILNLRKRLVAETNALSGSVDPTKLVGLRRIAANLRQMANCQSFAGGGLDN